jgi:hypothetical protein
MRVIALAAVLVLAACAAHAEIDGASVSLVSPGIVVPGQTYTFTFQVQNASGDGEAITNVAVSFPDGFTLFPATMSYVPIVPSPVRPDWTMYVPPIDHTGRWDDANGGGGEIYATESTTISIDVTVASVLYGTPVFWCLWGDGSGAAPHQICGCIDLDVSAVETASWSAIKALFR